MPLNLSIKSVPEELVEKLRKRAEKNHRSLQGELMTILEENLMGTLSLSSSEAIKKLREFNLKTKSDSVKIIRSDRNSR